VGDNNLKGLLCYLLGWLTGIIFILIDKDSYVRFHAMQSILTFGGLTVLDIIVSFLGSAGLGLWLIMGLIRLLIGLVGLVLWIVLMVKAYKGERFKLPIVGDMAENYAGKGAGM
jgi:uncharacterized membrane protein